jgi:hypothetical protein
MNIRNKNDQFEWGFQSKLKNFKRLLKIKETVEKMLISGTKCPNQGLSVENTFKLFQARVSVPFIYLFYNHNIFAHYELQTICNKLLRYHDSPTEPRTTEPRMGLLSEWTQPRMGLNPEWD